MITDQEKIKEAIAKAPKHAEYGEMMKEHQNMTLNMVSMLEEQKQNERDDKMHQLVTRLDQIEKERQEQFQYDYYSALQAQQQMQQQQQYESIAILCITLHVI